MWPSESRASSLESDRFVPDTFTPDDTIPYSEFPQFGPLHYRRAECIFEHTKRDYPNFPDYLYLRQLKYSTRWHVDAKELDHDSALASIRAIPLGGDNDSWEKFSASTRFPAAIERVQQKIDMLMRDAPKASNTQSAYDAAVESATAKAIVQEIVSYRLGSLDNNVQFWDDGVPDKGAPDWASKPRSMVGNSLTLSILLCDLLSYFYRCMSFVAKHVTHDHCVAIVETRSGVRALAPDLIVKRQGKRPHPKISETLGWLPSHILTVDKEEDMFADTLLVDLGNVPKRKNRDKENADSRKRMK